MSTKNKKINPDSWAFSDLLYGAMLALVVGVMPLIVHITVRAVPVDVRHLITGNNPEMPYVYGDVFAYGKSVVLVIAAVVMLFYFVASQATSGKLPPFKLHLKRAPIFLSLVYLAFVLISTLIPGYSYTAWFGTFDRGEGAIIWLMYFIVFTAAMLYVRELKYTKPIIWGLTFSSILMGIAGVTQLFGNNILATGPMVSLITSGVDVERFGERFVIAHGTLYNPNTFGKYTAMVAPILLLCGFVYEGKLYTKALILLGGALMLVGIFASGSLGGLIGIIAAVGILVITYVCHFLFRGLKTKEGRLGLAKTGLAFCVVAIIVSVSLVFVAPLNYRFTTLLNRLQEAAAAETATQERFAFDGAKMMAYRGTDRLFELTVHSFDDSENWFTVRDGTGAEVVPLEITRIVPQGRTIYEFNVPNFSAITVDRRPEIFLVGTPRQRNPYFLVFNNGHIYARDHRGQNLFNPSQPVPAWGFEGRETWGSSRGYIWSRTFPLMPSRILFGRGPDTFINAFPYHDMTGLHLAFDNPYQVVDKAHNLFLQTWVSTGGISAIALFALFFLYMATTFWSIIKSQGEPRYCFGLRLGLLAGVSGFVMSSMATDSTIGSTGVFFVLLGMGYGLNWFLKNQGETADNETKNAAKPNNKA